MPSRSRPAKRIARAQPRTLPLYRRIERALERRIAAGRYPLASLLPTEADLCEEFSASRHTVREALRHLTDNGLVARRQGAGTLVVSASRHDGFVQSVRSLEDLSQYALQTYYVIHAEQSLVLDREIAARVGGSAGATWICVSGVRWTGPGGRPISYVQSYVPMRLRPFVAEFRNTRGPFYDLLQERSGETIEEVLQEIQAVAMPQAIADALGLEPGRPSLQLLRRYVSRRGTLIASVNWHRADQFTYRMQLHRRSRASTGGGS